MRAFVVKVVEKEEEEEELKDRRWRKKGENCAPEE